MHRKKCYFQRGKAWIFLESRKITEQKKTAQGHFFQRNRKNPKNKH